jgi:hypothetical protein
MEEPRDDLIVIFAGHKDRMDIFFRSNPRMASRAPHHINFSDYTADESFTIARMMSDTLHYKLVSEAEVGTHEYIAQRLTQSRFANALSIRNSIDRTRLRMANRLFSGRSEPIERAVF